VLQFKPPGVECLPRRERISQSTIEHVSHDRCAEMSRVHPDLMGSPGVKPALDQAHRAGAQAPLGQLPEHRARRAPAVTADDRHSDSLRGVPPDGFINLGPIRCVALHQRQIATPHPARRNLISKMGHGALGSGYHHQAAGVLVQPMNDPRARQSGLAHEAMEQAVQQGAVPVTGTGVHHQAGVLIDHQERIVFVGQIERNLFGRKRSLGLQRLHLDQQGFDSGQSVPAPQHTLVPADRSELDPALQPRTGILRQRPREEPIQALAVRPRSRQLVGTWGRIRGRQQPLGMTCLPCNGHSSRFAFVGYNDLMNRHILNAVRLLGVWLMLVLSGCGTFDQPDETVGWPPDKLYSEARKDLDRRSWPEAIKLLEKLESRYPFGRWAEQAQLQIAYAHYRNNERVLAIAALDRFIKLHPSHPALDYALYMKGVVNFNEQEGLFAALGRQDLAERDLTAARDAFDSFRTLINRFPQSQYAADAQQRMVYLVDAMASGELAVARYYFRRGAYVAAANRAQAIVRQFPSARSTEQALIMLADAYDKLGMADLRDDTRRVLQKTFPQTASSAPAEPTSWWRFWR